MSLPTILVYSHSEYKDVWPIFIGESKKYLSDFKIVFGVDKYSESLSEYKQYLYNESDIYTERLKTLLLQLEDKYIIHLHEDFIPNGFPDISKIKHIYELMVKNKQIDFVRLIRSGYTYPNLISCTVFGVEHTDYLFAYPLLGIFLISIQSTIWKVDSFIDILTNCKASSATLLEQNSDWCRVNKILGLFTFDKLDKSISPWSYDSTIFPYFSTLIRMGSNCCF